MRHRSVHTTGFAFGGIALLCALGCAADPPALNPAGNAGTTSVAGNSAGASGSKAPGTAGTSAGESGKPGPMASDAGAPRATAGRAATVPMQTGKEVPISPGYLRTQGSKLLDSQGREVRLTGLSWFGMETGNYAPHGLWSRSLASMLDQIKSLGYNMIRLPFCTQFFDAGSTPNGIDMGKNPELNGLRGLALLDKIVAGAGQRGLKVVLDRHRPDSNAQSELWYTQQYSEQRFIDDWKMLATHYKGNATVIGFDLHNEPHGTATWGDGNMLTDWRLAAERAGNAVLAINSDLLIIVEGVHKFENSGYWWGGNLRGALEYPVRLDVRDRLVYSPHDYPKSVNDQVWFNDATYPTNMPRVWDDNWAYIARMGIAPIWVGEFGTKNQTSSDQQWLMALTNFIQTNQLSFAFWCLNPDSGDTGGILKDDWISVNEDKQSLLRPLLAPPL